MNSRKSALSASVVTLLALVALSASTGCSSSAADEEADGTQDALRTRDLDKYGITFGFVASDAAARALHQTIKASGGKDLGNHAVLAGLTQLDLGLASEGGDDFDQGFGIICQAAEGDATFHADTCSLSAVVEISAQTPGVVTLTGKLAKAVASALPRTSPKGLVGSATTGAGPISCKTTPGPTGSTCTLQVAAVVSSFAEMVTGEGAIKAADAKTMIKAFFPGA